MAGPGVVIGQRQGPFAGRLTPDLIRRYALATKDPNPGPLGGDVVPAVAVVTQIWDAQQAGYDELVTDETKASMSGGLHGEHDVVLHRPVVADEDLFTWVEGFGSRRAGRHNLVTLRYATYDRDEILVAEQWWTTVFLNAVGEPTGEPAPEHTLPEGAGANPVGEYRVRVDVGMPRRYAEVSNDWPDHHFDDEYARRGGFQGRFLHGLCTMGLCAQGVVLRVAAGDPERVRRLAVRFAAPTYVGDELVVRIFQVGSNSYGFEAAAGGATVIRHGLAELSR